MPRSAAPPLDPGAGAAPPTASFAPVPIPNGAVCTRDDDPAAIRAAFTAHGFCVFRAFLGAAEVADCLHRIHRVVGGLSAAVESGRVPAADAMYDDVSLPDTLKQIQHLNDNDGDADGHFSSLMQDILAPLASSCLGEGVTEQNMQVRRRRT